MGKKEDLAYLSTFPGRLEDIVDALYSYLDAYGDTLVNSRGEVIDNGTRELIALKHQTHELRWRLKGWIDEQGK